jgi:hypothetical protein
MNTRWALPRTPPRAQRSIRVAILFFLPVPFLRLFGAAAAIHASFAAAGILDLRSHGRHRVRNRNSRDAAASLRLLGATAATQFFCGFVFPSSFLPTAEIRSGPMGVPD